MLVHSGARYVYLLNFSKIQEAYFIDLNGFKLQRGMLCKFYVAA
jgi:hypothetical protein